MRSARTDGPSLVREEGVSYPGEMSPVRSEPCRLCGHDAALVSEGVVLGRHPVGYYLCARCDHLQAQAPYWLAEAYQSPISRYDTGMVARGSALASKVQAILWALGLRGCAGLDFGAGTGLFVRLMRDRGFDYRWADRYAQNIFAQGFEWKQEKVALVTCFECFEHFSEPGTEIAEVLSLSELTIATTALRANRSVPSADWHYYGFEHGQHISFHSEQSLDFAAQKSGRHRLSFGDLHVFSKEPLSRRRLATALQLRHPLEFAMHRMLGTQAAALDAEQLRNARPT